MQVCIAGDGVGKAHFGDDVGERQPPARTQQASGLSEHVRLVDREIHDAVADDDVRRAVWGLRKAGVP